MASGGQFNRNKVWDDEKLTDTDLNAEFDHFLNRLDATYLGSGDTSAADARVTKDPGTYASPNVAADIQDEFQHLRYILGQIIGGANDSHLDAVPTNLAALSGSSRDVAFGIEFEGENNGASTTTGALATLISRGGIINAASLSSADVDTSSFDATNVKFGKYSYACGSGNILAFPGTEGSSYKGGLSAWFRNLAAGDYIAFNPLLGIELYCEPVSGFLETKITEAASATESTKATTTVTGATGRTGDATFRNAIMGYSLNDSDGASTDAVSLYYEGVAEGTQVTGDNIDINPGHGGTWFVGCKPNNPLWDHFYAASGLPTAHSSAWTSNGSPGASVSNGVLNISTSATTGFYSRTTLVDLANQTIEWKARVNSATKRAQINSNVGMCMQILDDSLNRSVRVTLNNGKVIISNGAAGTAVHEADIELHVQDWHVYRLTSVLNGSDVDMKLYINGVLVHAWTNTTADSTATDHIQFGSIGSGTVNADIEYVKVYDAGAEAPVIGNNQGNIDSFGLAKTPFSSTIRSTLQTSAFTNVLVDSGDYGAVLPLQKRFKLQATVGASTNSFADGAEGTVYYIAGDGKTQYIFQAIASADTGGANTEAYLAVDIDNDVNAVVPTNANLWFPFGYIAIASSASYRHLSCVRAVTLPVGLHEVRLNIARGASGSTSTFLATSMNLVVSKRLEIEGL